MDQDIAATRRSVLVSLVAGSTLSASAVKGQDAGLRAGEGPAGQFVALSGRIATPSAFGAKGDMKADDTQALQACLDTGLPVVIPDGRFRITRPLQVCPGQIVTGMGRVGSATGAAIVNQTPGGGCLWYTQDTGTDRKPMPMIANLHLSADFPIRFNEPEQRRIGDAGDSDMPYGVRPVVQGCRIVARQRGTGMGIAWSKMFDGIIEGCEVEGFAINILLQGCDINAVRRNRLVLGGRYHILELSVLSFGSQNLIEHNDILQAGSDDCIFIKSTARHARIRDNYLEHIFRQGADDASVSSFPGFIDASAVGAPRFGGNGAGERFTTVISGNRIDGVKHVREFVYRYEPEGQTYGEIIDPGTTGEALVAGAASLKLVDRQGRNIDRVPFIFNEINTAAFVFQSPAFGRWNGYRTNHNPVSSIDGTNCAMFGAVLFGDGANHHVAARGSRIVIGNALPSRVQFLFGADDERFIPGHAYRYVLSARTVGGQETLSIGRLDGLQGSAEQTFALSSRFQQFTWDTIVPPASRDRHGFYLICSRNGHDIEIERIDIVKRFIDELPRTEGGSAILTLTGDEGEILVEADDGRGRQAMAIYRMIGGHLQPVLARSDDEVALTIRANWRSPHIGIAVVGNAARKAIHIGRILS